MFIYKNKHCIVVMQNENIDIIINDSIYFSHDNQIIEDRLMIYRSGLSNKNNIDKLHINEDNFINKENTEKIKDTKNSNNELRGKKDKSFKRKYVKILKNLKVPNSLIAKIKRNEVLSDSEKEVLHNRGIEFCRSEKVASHIRIYTGGTFERLCNLEKANIKKGIKK